MQGRRAGPRAGPAPWPSPLKETLYEVAEEDGRASWRQAISGLLPPTAEPGEAATARAD